MTLPPDDLPPRDTQAGHWHVGQWKELTQKGNHCFHNGDTSEAITHYQHARDHAIRYFGFWPSEDDATAALVVSCLNLAEASLREGQRTEAIHVLCTVHGHLLMTSHNPLCPESVRTAAQHHLKETLAALSQFEATHGTSPETTAAIQLTFQIGPMFHKAGLTLH
ncbi:MAG: tetratricopeptide repeat protein [Asticcacaulis sp.]